MSNCTPRIEELDAIRKAAEKHATMVDHTHYKVGNDPYRTLLAVVNELKAQGWKSGFICGDDISTKKSITVFPPGQEPEARGTYFKLEDQARRYTIYMDLA